MEQPLPKFDFDLFKDPPPDMHATDTSPVWARWIIRAAKWKVIAMHYLSLVPRKWMIAGGVAFTLIGLLSLMMHSKPSKPSVSRVQTMTVTRTFHSAPAVSKTHPPARAIATKHKKRAHASTVAHSKRHKKHVRSAR